MLALSMRPGRVYRSGSRRNGLRASLPSVGGTVRLTSTSHAAAAAIAAGRGAHPPVLQPRFAVLLAVAGGLLLAGAFPPIGIWPLATVGPALLIVALWQQRARTAFFAGLAFGLAFFFPLLTWLVNVAWYVWTALAVAEAVVFAVEALGQWLLLRLRAWPVAVAGWWVTVEAIRARWPYQFPWGRLAMSQSAAPTVRWVAVGGPVLLTFLLGLTAACLAWLVIGPRPRPDSPPVADRRPAARARAGAALALVATGGLTACGALLPSGQPGAGGRQRTAVVAAVQGNVPHGRDLTDQLRRATIVTQNHATATDRLAARIRQGAAPAPDVVIWPENSTDEDPRFDQYAYNLISGAVATIDRPVLVGAVLNDPQRNTGELWLPGHGPVGAYVKRQLVPFGEYIPLRGLIDKVTSLPSLVPINFTPGNRPVVFDLGKVRLGDVICYEVGFDGLVRSEVAAGSNLLAMQTNDADFELDGQMGETTQQLAMARLRAVEFDRSVVVASTTGVSAIIDPDGAVIMHTGTWRQAEIEAAVPLRTADTLALRVGGWPEGLISAATATALLLAIGQLIRQRRRLPGRVLPPAQAGE